MHTEIESPVMNSVREIILPIVADLGLDLYDLEQRGGTLRVTLDTPPGSPGGVTLDALSLASRLVSKELDQHDPIPSRYTLEVTSPGLERTLRKPEHFRREVGKQIAVRLSGVESADRRVEGAIVAADDRTVTLHVGEGAQATERVIDYGQIDRARTVFEWGPQPKPGHAPKTKHDAKRSSPEPAEESDPADEHEDFDAAPAASPVASSEETGPRRSGGETRFGTAAAPAASPAASSTQETGPRRSGGETRFGTAAAPAASPAASSEEHTSERASLRASEPC